MGNINTEEKEGIRENIAITLVPFIMKTLIIFTIFFVSLGAFIPKFHETERNKLILLSFIQNPYVLWRLSLIEENAGNKVKAEMYLEAAIGLLEMNGASEKTLSNYHSKLNTLKK